MTKDRKKRIVNYLAGEYHSKLREQYSQLARTARMLSRLETRISEGKSIDTDIEAARASFNNGENYAIDEIERLTAQFVAMLEEV